MPQPLKVLYLGSECAPFAKTGGLGDVAGALPKALARRDLDVRVMLPLYRGLPWDDFEVLEGVLEVPVGDWLERGGVRMGHLPGSEVPIYFLEHLRYFDRPEIYGEGGSSYWDNLDRFTFFSRGALQLCNALEWIPDVVNANDWQTALVPVFLNTVEQNRPLHATASLFTIHNLAHQGVFGLGDFWITGLAPWDFKPYDFQKDGDLNLMKAALRHATLLSTVSPTYAREIQSPAQGRGLDDVLSERAADLHGLLNGIDVHEWDPASDRHLPATFDADHLEGKAACKTALQREAGLSVDPEVPLFGVVARLDAQKGLDVLAEALPRLLDLDLQMVLLGTGDPSLEAVFREASRQRPGRFHADIRFSTPLAHRIEAGADFFLMPSRFEPCGLNQLYSLRYGTLPIVRATGGLADTVWSYEEGTGAGTGFVFQDLHPQALYDVAGWALYAWYERRDHIDAMRRRAMRQDFSWERSAAAYESVYREAVARRRGG